MEIISHEIKNIKIAEITGTGLIIKNVEDGLALLGDLYYQGFDAIIMTQQQLIPEFFDLSTGIAGEILQKFSNYRMRLAIVGDFSRYAGKSIKDFILECNKGRHINFVGSSSEALEKLANLTGFIN